MDRQLVLGKPVVDKRGSGTYKAKFWQQRRVLDRIVRLLKAF